MSAKPVANKLAEDARDYWKVTPEAGFVIKTKCTVRGPKPNPSKLFINVGHCPQLPIPLEDVEEEEILRHLETDPSKIKIATCVGNLEVTQDKDGATARKVDVLVNSIFYKKRVERSEFYRQLLFLVLTPSVEQKHNLNIDVKAHNILRQTKVWDTMSEQLIRKSPAECLIQESNVMTVPVDAEDMEAQPALDIQNFEASVIAGRIVEVQLKVTDTSGAPVTETNRIRLRMNDDRIVVIVDNKRSIADFFLPYTLKTDEADADFDTQTSLLTIRCPIDW